MTDSVPASLISHCADRYCTALRQTVGLLVGMTVVLILLNLVTRALQMALFWVDELAVYCMVWASMLGAATTVYRREAIAVQLIPPLLSPRGRLGLQAAADLLTLLFSFGLLYCCWLWFNPVLLLRVDFDITQFIRESYNFVYRDPSNTLGIPRFWIWLIMPLTAISLCVFSLANLIDSFRRLRHGETP